MGRNRRNNEPVELEIESIGLEGIAIAKKDGMVYMLKNAIPGDKVNARITKKKKSYAEASVLELISPSPNRIEAKCEYFDHCGGCSWQMLDYERQLQWKQQNVIDVFERIGKVKVGKFEDTLPSPEQFHYRNKMEFSFGASRWMLPEEIAEEENITRKNFALGLHIPGRFDKVLDLEKCYIHPHKGHELLNKIRNKALETGAQAYNSRDHEGFLRNLVLRYSIYQDKIICMLITANAETPEAKAFLDWYYNQFEKEVNGNVALLHTINDTKSPVASGEIQTIKDEPDLIEEVLGIKFRISPYSFFQTNSLQLNRFISNIIDYANLKKSDIVWDLFCGTGSITLPASKHVKEIYGLELVDSSVQNARENAEFNNIENAHFIKTDLNSKEIPEILNSLPQPDVILIDPPRAGMHKNLVAHLQTIKADKIVYVSCNPATQARDINMLSEIYDVEKVRPVDMFPQTYHVESIALLIKR